MNSGDVLFYMETERVLLVVEGCAGVFADVLAGKDVRSGGEEGGRHGCGGPITRRSFKSAASEEGEDWSKQSFVNLQESLYRRIVGLDILYNWTSLGE